MAKLERKAKGELYHVREIILDGVIYYHSEDIKKALEIANDADLSRFNKKLKQGLNFNPKT